MGTCDCKPACLTGETHDRCIYVKPPKDGLPGVRPGSLLKHVAGAYGCREAPRCWYLRAREVRLTAGLGERQTAKACVVLCVPTTRGDLGMFVLHGDNAGFPV